MAWVLFVRKNTVKTVIRISRINFYFVTCFYSLDDICMFGHEDMFFRQENMKNMFFLVMFSCQRKIIIFVSKL